MTTQTFHPVEESHGNLGPGELRNLGGVLVFVPAVVEPRHLQAAINYLLAQLNVRDQADQGGT